MIAYVIILFILFIFLLLDFSKNKKIQILSISIFGIIMVIFAGFRWDVGTDWEQYLYAFNNIENLDFGESGYELFYEIILRYAQLIFGTFTAMLLITALFIISLTYYTLGKLSPFPMLSALLLLAYSINSSGFGYRQDMAIAVLFFSTFFIIKRQKILFLVFIFFAFLFHQSAIAFLPAYWLFSLKWNRKFVLVIIISVVLGYFISSNIFSIIGIYTGRAAGQLEAYSDLSYEELSAGSGDPYLVLIRGILNRLFLLVLPLLVLLKKDRQQRSDLLGFYNLFLFGTIFYIVLSPLGIVFLRFTRYYDIYQILVIPILYKNINKNYQFIFIFMIIIYCFLKYFLVLSGNNNVYVPYKFFF